MEKLTEIEKQNKEKFNYNKDVGKVALLLALQEIDKNVKMENIENLHPDDFDYLFNLFWNNGRELVKSYVENFRKKTR